MPSVAASRALHGARGLKLEAREQVSQERLVAPFTGRVD